MRYWRGVRRPGFLSDLSDTWMDDATTKRLAKQDANILEQERTDYVDTGSGAARPAQLPRLASPGAARLSSANFLLKHAKWYDQYRRKVLYGADD